MAKKCLREEARKICNGNPTKWEKDTKKAMAEIDEEEVWGFMR